MRTDAPLPGPASDNRRMTHDTHAMNGTMVQLQRQGRIAIVRFDRGFNMSWDAVPRITALVGPARAKRMVVLAEQLDAPGAAAWGLADAVAPDGGAVDAALVLAERAAAMPPNGVHMCKTAINAHAHALAGATSHADRDQFALLQASADGAAGVNAFLDKPDPVFTGG